MDNTKIHLEREHSYTQTNKQTNKQTNTHTQTHTKNVAKSLTSLSPRSSSKAASRTKAPRPPTRLLPPLISSTSRHVVPMPLPARPTMCPQDQSIITTTTGGLRVDKYIKTN